jgi:hypothetical protein
LSEFGTGRSILVDRDGVIVAGNQTAQQAALAGIEDVILVPTDGTKLVVVQRTDLSMDDPKACGLAIADNRTAELGLEWNPEILGELAQEMDLQPFFTDAEQAEITGIDELDPCADAEWEGMPAADNEDVALRHITIHFHSDADVTAFAELVRQKITPKTKYLWYPAEKPITAKLTKYVTNND